MTYSPRCVEKLFGNSELSRIGATKRPRGVKEVPIGCLLAPKKSARDTFCYFPNSFGRGILGSSFARSCIERPPRAATMASEATDAAWEGTACSRCVLDLLDSLP